MLFRSFALRDLGLSATLNWLQHRYESCVLSVFVGLIRIHKTRAFVLVRFLLFRTTVLLGRQFLGDCFVLIAKLSEKPLTWIAFTATTVGASRRI